MSVLELSFASGESSLSVRRFAVHEELSSLFSISIWGRSPNDDIHLGAIIGKPASFRVSSGLSFALFEGARCWSGICSHMELIQAETTGLSTYFLRIVPRLWLLTQRRNHRIFQRASVPDIVGKILAEWKIEPTWRIDRPAYPKFEYRVQYGESDYAFISRLLEDAGITFVFTDAGDDRGSQIIFYDAPQHNESRPGLPIPYVDNPNEAAEIEFVTNVRIAEEVRPGRFTVRDHDFRRQPEFKLLGETPAPGTEDDLLEQYVYGPGAFALIQGGTAAESKALALPGSTAGNNGQQQDKNGGLSDLKRKAVDAVDDKVTKLVNDEVTQLLNSALKDVTSQLAADVAADVLAGLASEVAGNVAGKLMSDMIGGGRDSFDLDFEKILRNTMKKVVDKRLGGFVDKKVTKFVTKKLKKVGSEKFQELMGEAAGELAKAATKAAGGQILDLMFGEEKKDEKSGGAGQGQSAAEGTQVKPLALASTMAAPRNGNGTKALALACNASDQLLAGDDKGAVRHDDKAGRALAQRTLESIRTGQKSLSFDTNALDLQPGTIFSIASHPRADLSPSTRLLVAGFSVEGTPGGEWSMNGHAVFADQPYRPQRKTPKPKIEGLQSAIVVGPKGQEIHTDEFGRVRVQFHWDREGQFNDDSSLWMRVSQGWAGPGYGMMGIPRVGTEVLVAFLEGDPDHPVAMGRLFSTTSPTPHKLPDNKTVTAWRSDSSPGSGGFNEILFEDHKGRELLFMQAEKNLRKLVKNDEIEVTQGDRRKTVGGDLTQLVMFDQTETTGVDRTITVGENLLEALGANHEIKVGGSHSESIAKNMFLRVGPKPEEPTEEKEENAAGGKGSEQGTTESGARTPQGGGTPTPAPNNPFAGQLERVHQNNWLASIEQAEQAHNLPPGLLLAVGSRETQMRNILGDHGHGRGFFQIDDRYHAEWLAARGAGGAGQIPSVEDAAPYAAGLLAQNIDYARSHGVAEQDVIPFALSAYNAGQAGAMRGYRQGNADQFTTGGDYAQDVLGRHANIVQALGDQPQDQEQKDQEKKQEETGNFKIEVANRLEIEVGQAKLIITKDGKVSLNGVEFDFSASGPVQIKGSVIDLN